MRTDHEERPAKVRIDSSIPIPTTEKKIYPFDDLKVGQSFHIPDHSKSASLRAQASRKGKQLGRRFLVKKTETGIRVWRKK